MEEENYLKIRTVDEFLIWIDSINKNRQGTDQSNEYRNRTGLWKRYADEAEPLGRFLRGNMDIPRTTLVAMSVQTDLPDATLTIGEEKIPIEITTTDYPGAVHNRRQLNDHGFGPGETNSVFTGKDLAYQQSHGNPRDLGQVRSAVYMQRQELDRYVSDYAKSIRFYDKILLPLGWARLVRQKSHTTYSDGAMKIVFCPTEESYQPHGYHH